MTFFINTDQVSKTTKYVYKQPKYDKSTTDPTYYEPAATRIANMKKASGVIMEGIYDFYTKDDVSKFNEKNFSKNIGNAAADPHYIKGLTQEEITQVTNTYSQKMDLALSDKNEKAEKKNERIAEQLEVSDKINAKNNNENPQNNYTK